jgi:hypothetical protein
MPNKYQLTYLITETKESLDVILQNQSRSKLKLLAEYLKNKQEYLEEMLYDIYEDNDQRGGGKTNAEFAIEKQLKRIKLALDKIEKLL